jgi:SAM-dependent methyltransferase
MTASLAARLLVAFLLVCGSALAQAADAKKGGDFEPWVGLPGKDVIWLPAELVMVNKMLDLARVTSADTVMDLGSGDGRTVIGAAKRGARGIGVEFNPDLVEFARRNAQREGVSERVTFENGDLFQADITRATVITLFLLPSINVRLRPKLLELKPGTRIVSNTFTMDEWKADDTLRDEAKGITCQFNCQAFLWVIPAKAAGRWQLPDGELVLEQRFQMLTGTLNTSTLSIPVAGRVLADQVLLSGRGLEFSGRLSGNTLEGSYKGVNSGPWKAVRK